MKRTSLIAILAALMVLVGCTAPSAPTADELFMHSKSSASLSVGQTLFLENAQDATSTHEVLYSGVNGGYCVFQVDGESVNLFAGLGKSYSDGNNGYIDLLCNAEAGATSVEVQFTDEWISSIQ